MKYLFKRLRERLPKKYSEEEVDEHYRKISSVGGLEKNDFLAMLIAAFLTLGLPLLLILAVIYGSIYLLFIR
ncbi:MAG TPA: hypothetical protein PKN71_02580 [Bacillota bacterium]|nr:hypothetical protein [Bacillota bacterium]